MFDTLKIICIGPTKSGKTKICNYLLNGDKSKLTNNYEPTIGTRILEFEKEIDMDNVDVELWDCSGDRKFENCWNAIENNTDGIILVYSPDDKINEREIKLLYTRFVKNSKFINNEQCIGISWSEQGNIGMCIFLLYYIANLLDTHFIPLSPDNIENINDEFKSFLGKCANIKSRKNKENTK